MGFIEKDLNDVVYKLDEIRDEMRENNSLLRDLINEIEALRESQK